MSKIRHANPSHGPVHICKYDIKDGYYRMFLNANDCPRLSIILPRYEGEEQLIAIPMSTTIRSLTLLFTPTCNSAIHCRNLGASSPCDPRWLPC